MATFQSLKLKKNTQCTIELRAQHNPLQCNGLALWTAACTAPLFAQTSRCGQRMLAISCSIYRCLEQKLAAWRRPKLSTFHAGRPCEASHGDRASSSPLWKLSSTGHWVQGEEERPRVTKYVLRKAKEPITDQKWVAIEKEAADALTTRRRLREKTSVRKIEVEEKD